MKKICIYLLLLFMSCKTRNNSCGNYLMKDVLIRHSNTSIKMPSRCILVDSLIFDKATIANDIFQNTDTSFLIIIKVRKSDLYPEIRKQIRYQADEQKNDISSIDESVNKITDTVFIINNVKVGYLKYYGINSGTLCPLIESRIFYYKDQRFISISLAEKYFSQQQKRHSISDCMIETLDIN